MSDYPVELRRTLNDLRAAALFRLATIKRWDIGYDEVRQLVDDHIDHKVIDLSRSHVRSRFTRPGRDFASQANREDSRPRESLAARFFNRVLGRR